jgi:hypothetical protein
MLKEIDSKSHGHFKINSLLIKTIIIIVFIQIIFAKLMWDDFFSLIRYADEMITVIGLLYLMTHLRELKNIRSFKYCISFLCAYIFLGFLSNINTDTPLLPAWLQVFLDLKIFATVILIQQMGNNTDISKWGIRFFKLILLLNIPLLIFQFADIDSYHSIFANNVGSGDMKISGVTFYRGSGIFWHPSQLAVFTSFAVYLFFAIKKTKIWMLLASIQLLSSTQRQEIFTLVFVLILLSILLIAKRHKKMLPVYLLTAVVIFAVFTVIFFNIFSESLSDYISLNFSESKDARIVFTIEGGRLAAETFPLGSGFGTFGGYSALYFDSPLYMKLNFHFYHWYREGKWMTDTFYPHIIAESGYVGFICYIASIVCFFKYISDSMNNNAVKKACFFSCTYLLLCSVTSPVFNDSLSIVLCILIPLILNNRKLPI